jgi:hypothetical protein
MHAVHRIKCIIETGKNFFLNYPIYKHSAKFCFLKFEGKAYEIRLLLLRVNIKNYNPQLKISASCQCTNGFNLALSVNELSAAIKRRKFPDVLTGCQLRKKYSVPCC